MTTTNAYTVIAILTLLLSLQSPFISANCDVYKRTMDSIDYWHSYDFSKGMDEAVQTWYAPDARVTMPGTIMTTTPAEFYAASRLEITKLKIDVRDIDCASDGEWCHLKVFTTYHNAVGETVSIPQYWTYLYDPVTCLWAHYIILLGSNDLEYMIDTLSAHRDEQADEL
jgi:hypothetical protein